jgi:glycosyltransferase involved in cell wall biosynthesis
MRLAILSTHPIQYNAPLFKLLAAEKKVDPLVFYTWGESGSGAKYDPDFGRKVEWDIPLLDGYAYRFVRNTAKSPGTHHFNGIVNPGLIREIEEWAPDAIMVFGWNFRSHLACLRHFHGKIPVLFRGDSTLIDEHSGIRKWFRRQFLRWVYRHVDYALYVGAQNKRYFLRHGLSSNQLFFAPHSIDIQRFQSPDQEYADQAKAWKKQLGIGEECFTVLFAGKLEPKKNPMFLLELASEIDHPSLRILIVGNGVLEGAIRKLAENDPRILFLDFQNQLKMPVVYRLCSVFILPSAGPGETWGLAINEAMACGRAVFVSDKAGCAADLVVTNWNGLVFGSGDIATCARFLKQLLKDRTRIEEMGVRSQRMIRDYTFQQVADSLYELVDKITLNVPGKKGGSE